jgi:radical SAM enzyme (TIGR01210 family)
LYNAGSFFDPRALPPSDYAPVAAGLTGLERVIVESHPALVGDRVDWFLNALADHAAADVAAPGLEVAMGLETVHPAALDALNKRMTLDDFRRAADWLRERSIALRVFLLISPPGVHDGEQDEWLARSVDAAIACDASVVSLVPTRPGNGAMDTLSATDGFRQPALADIERSAAIGIERAANDRAARVFVDLWDVERFARCTHCVDARRDRLHRMNLEQRVVPHLTCERCSSG